MQEKIRNAILPISLFYMIVIVILMTLTYIQAQDTIEFKYIENFENKMANNKLEVNNLNDKVCEDALNKYIDYSIKYTYNGNVKVKTFFNDKFLNPDEIFLSNYLKIKDNCKLTDEQMKDNDLPNMFLNVTVLEEEILQKYLFNYEIKFNDIITRIILEPNIYNTEYSISQNLKLKIIDTVLEILKERKNEVLNEN